MKPPPGSSILDPLPWYGSRLSAKYGYQTSLGTVYYVWQGGIEIIFRLSGGV